MGMHAGRHLTSHCIPSLSIVYNFHIFLCTIFSLSIVILRLLHNICVSLSHSFFICTIEVFLFNEPGRKITYRCINYLNSLHDSLYKLHTCISRDITDTYASSMSKLLLLYILEFIFAAHYGVRMSIINLQLTTTYRYATTNTQQS